MNIILMCPMAGDSDYVVFFSSFYHDDKIALKRVHIGNRPTIGEACRKVITVSDKHETLY